MHFVWQGPPPGDEAWSTQPNDCQLLCFNCSIRFHLTLQHSTSWTSKGWPTRPSGLELSSQASVTINCSVEICSSTHLFFPISQISTQCFLFHWFNSAHSAFFRFNSNQHTVLVTIVFHLLWQVRLRHGSRSKADFPRHPRRDPAEEVGLHACNYALYLYIYIYQNTYPYLHIAHIMS